MTDALLQQVLQNQQRILQELEGLQNAPRFLGFHQVQTVYVYINAVRCGGAIWYRLGEGISSFRSQSASLPGTYAI